MQNRAKDSPSMVEREVEDAHLLISFDYREFLPHDKN
jgi:hypothetical protein